MKRPFARMAALSIAVFAIWAPNGYSQEVLIFGKWKIDPAKTTNAPESETRVYENRGGGFILSTRRGIDSHGREFYSQYAAKHDEKEYPRLVKGSLTINTIAFKQMNPYTSTFILRTEGKVTGRGRTTVSNNGKILTIETTGVDDGWTAVEVYDKQ